MPVQKKSGNLLNARHILFIMMWIVSLTHTLVKKLSTSRDAAILWLVFCVCSICICSWVDFTQYLVGRYGVMSSFKVYIDIDIDIVVINKLIRFHKKIKQ